MEKDVIVAQATPHGKGAIALIRLSGKEVRHILDKCAQLKSKQKIAEVKTHTIHYGTIYDKDENIIDNVLFLVTDGPRSFTGENAIEITSHNNPFIINKIIERTIECGARRALPGEYSERAVLNKKIDLLQAEAIHDLLSAQSELQTQLALGQLEGTLSAEIQKIDDELCALAAWSQASFEFLDEERDFQSVILEKAESIKKSVESLLNQHNFSTLIKEGLKIGIIGSTNVGKSSLLNVILNQKKAIVTDIPGTTRDVVEGTLYKDNIYWTFLDTAGIRKTADLIEQTGIQKSHEIAEKADILLVVFTFKEEEDQEIKKTYHDIIMRHLGKIIFIRNKIDLSHQSNISENFFSQFSSLAVSTHTLEGIEEIIAAIQKKKEELFNTHNISFLLNTRHVSALTETKEKLEYIVKLLRTNSPLYEIILMLIHETQKTLTLMSGKTVEEKSFDKVFRSFCVGK